MKIFYSSICKEFVLILFVLFSESLLAQNWFPLNKDNHWLYSKDRLVSNTHMYSYSSIIILGDTLLGGKKYFRLTNIYDYGNDFLFYYDQNQNILYGRTGNLEYVIIDFKKPNNYKYYQLAPDGTFRNVTVKDFTVNFADTTFNCKGFYSNGSYCYFAPNVGMVQTFHYTNTFTNEKLKLVDYKLTDLPSNHLHFPTTISDTLLPKVSTSNYEQLTGYVKPIHPITSSAAVQFVDKMWVEWFYKKNNNILNIDTISGTYIAGLGKFSFTGESFNFNLLEDGYSINYRYIVKTKYLQNNIEYVPDSGYIKIDYPKKSFLPFAVNNKWQYYEFYFPSGSVDSIYLRSFWLEQNGDSLAVNNKKYFAVENSLSGFKDFYRFDFNDPKLYLYDSTIGAGEYFIENVDKKINDILFDSRFGQNHKVKFTSSKMNTSYSIFSEQRTYSSASSPGSYYILKDSIGLIYKKQKIDFQQYSDFKSTILAEAYINGRHFVSDILNVKDELPETYVLLQNFPNPFNPTTTIKYAVASTRHVQLKIYDVLGNEVAVLVDEEKSPGNYHVEFDASKFSSGVYICRLTTDSKTQSIKMMMMK